MALVSVVIVTWNGRHLLAECLDTLRAQTRPPNEILIVDNGSSDGSQQWVRSHYPEVTLIELAHNTGFSIANNIGIRRATGDYIALLNNDIRLEPEWLASMIAALDTEASLGSCACKMLLYHERDTIDSAGINLLKNGGGSNRGFRQADNELFQHRAMVFGACAGAALYRAEMLRHIGLFDEDLFIYYEDVDLAFRAQLAGYNCLYVPEAVAYHHHAATSSRLGTRLYYTSRNNLLVVAKNMPLALLLRYLPSILWRQLTFFLSMILQGQIGMCVRACVDMLRMLPLMLRKRQTARYNKSRSSSDIIALLS